MLSICSMLRNVFYKQRSRNFLWTISYSIAGSVVQIHVNLSVSFLMGTFIYIMRNLKSSFVQYVVYLLSYRRVHIVAEVTRSKT